MEQEQQLDELALQLHAELVDGAGSVDPTQPLELRIASLVADVAAVLDESMRAELVRRVRERSLGLGRLELLLADAAVDEIMVNGLQPIWVERAGRLEAVADSFATTEELEHTIDRILAPLGRRVDESEPMVDARLPDGSRVNIVVPPLALDGPTITIRRFGREAFSLERLVEFGSIDPHLGEVLGAAVRGRLNVVISGGTGSGKTTLLGALAGRIDLNERIVTIEDVAELRLGQPHVVRLEARPANVEGRGEVAIRQLVRNALRMRPDRILVGEVRGAEALDMVSAMSTGHEGSLSTVHAPDPEAAMRRLETLALMADIALPHSAVRAQLVAAIDLVVQVERLSDGARAVSQLAEVVRSTGSEHGVDDELTRTIYRRERGGRETWSEPRLSTVQSAIGASIAEAGR